MKFNLTTDKGNYRIDFTLEGKRKRFYPGTKDEIIANQLVKQMAYEWDTGKFDLTLQSYRLKNRTQPKPKNLSKEKDDTPQTLLALWDRYVESLHLSSSTRNGHYHLIRQAIKKHNPKVSDVSWFIELREVWSPKTWLGRKSYIKSCMDWAIEEGLFTDKNLYKALKPVKKVTPDRIKPFNSEEIGKILKALENNEFCNPHNRYKHSHYVPFVKFLLITGCRLGEATGLTWDCIDLDSKMIVIKQALGKDMSVGPNKTRKVLKETKTGNVRYIPMNNALLALLEGLFNQLEDNQLKADKQFVFKGHRGKYIDTASFRRNVWKPILEKLGIQYRYPYQTRHTVLSAVVSSHGLLAAAKLAGHKNLDMVSRHYARYTDDLADVLPNV